MKQEPLTIDSLLAKCCGVEGVRAHLNRIHAQIIEGKASFAGKEPYPIDIRTFDTKGDRKGCSVWLKDKNHAGDMQCSGEKVWCELPATTHKVQECERDEAFIYLRRCTAPERSE